MGHYYSNERFKLMALLDGTTQVTPEYTDGRFQRVSLFSIKNVDAGDTIDLAGYFKVVKRAGLISVTGTHVLQATVSANGTTLTVPAGPLDDSLALLVVGVTI